MYLASIKCSVNAFGMTNGSGEVDLGNTEELNCVLLRHSFIQKYLLGIDHLPITSQGTVLV